MPKPEQGRIIEVEIHDPKHRNVKVRPAVIVSETSEIQAEHQIWCVAVTGTFLTKLPDDCVLLPYHAQGHPRTGLKKRCVAIRGRDKSFATAPAGSAARHVGAAGVSRCVIGANRPALRFACVRCARR